MELAKRDRKEKYFTEMSYAMPKGVIGKNNLGTLEGSMESKYDHAGRTSGAGN